MLLIILKNKLDLITSRKKEIVNATKCIEKKTIHKMNINKFVPINGE